jgi:uncharacterized protein (DUF1499 family)
MKTAFIIVSLLFLAAAVLLALMGVMSRSGSAPGLIDNRLAPCPDKPNCVCSEYPADTNHGIDPMPLPVNGVTDTIPAIRQAIESLGGRIEISASHYLAATFSSPLFGFVDDLEVRIDPERAIIHFRSASRAGYSDMGVNRKRVHHLRAFLKNTFFPGSQR